MSCQHEYCACPECIEEWSRSRFWYQHPAVNVPPPTAVGVTPPIPDPSARLAAVPGYEQLAAVLDESLAQAQNGKGKERHSSGEPFVEQPIVAICESLGSAQFAVGQAHKKSRESLRLPRPAARRELLGAINYLAAAVLVIDRSGS